MFFRTLSSPLSKFNKTRLKEITSLHQSTVNSPSNGSQVTVEEVPNGSTDSFVCITQIRKTLKDYNAKYEDGFTCITTPCINCYEKKEGLIYINKRTGFFVCIDCQDSGDWRNVEPRIWKPVENAEGVSNESKIAIKNKIFKHLIQSYNPRWEELSTSCKAASSLKEEEITEIISHFKLPISPRSTVLKDLNALYDDDKKCLYFPLSNGKKRIVGIKQFLADGTEECEPFKNCYGILKYVSPKATQKCTDAVIVSNMRDLIALSACKHSHHIICIPYELRSLPQEILPLLEQYNKLILWFGHNPSSLVATRQFSKKLREERCYMIKLTDERPAEFIVKNKDVSISATLKTAEPILHESITTFSNFRQEVWAEITNTDSVQGIKWNRFPALNNLLKGHRRGELTILTGPTGSGKTTFLSEYSLDLAMQGVSTLWGSFEIRNQRLASTMLQQFSQEPFDDCQEKFTKFANQFEKLPIFFLKFHGQQSVEVVMNVVNHAFYVYDIQHVVIDNLQFMLGLSLHEERFMDRFYKQDKVIAAFRTFATQCNCHVTLIIHPRKERDTDELSISSIFGSAKASQEADNILIIQKKTLPTLHTKKYIQILKNRYSGDLGIMPVIFNKATMTFSGKNLKHPVTPNATYYNEEEFIKIANVTA